MHKRLQLHVLLYNLYTYISSLLYLSYISSIRLCIPYIVSTPLTATHSCTLSATLANFLRMRADADSSVLKKNNSYTLQYRYYTTTITVTLQFTIPRISPLTIFTHNVVPNTHTAHIAVRSSALE